MDMYLDTNVVVCWFSGYGSLAEARQALANLGLYKEFLLPGGVGVDIQSLIRPECEVVWEVRPCDLWL